LEQAHLNKTNTLLRHWSVKETGPNLSTQVRDISSALGFMIGRGFLFALDQSDVAFITFGFMFRAHDPASKLVIGKGFS
jgi:hypothetical protein